MKYNDEQLLNVENYELMAKAYSQALKQKGFYIVQIDNERNKELIEETYNIFTKIKYCLFKLGGFCNTSKMYSLTDRQLKKFNIMFDNNVPLNKFSINSDKTTCFLNFISLEALLIKNLLALSEQTSFEYEIKKIINDRLTFMSTLFQIKI